jgi:hypothetical protein
VIITTHLTGASSGLVKWGEPGMASLLTGEKIDEFFLQVKTTD